MEFNDLLKIKRKEKGYTQKEMAERLGITRGGYNNYEVGQSTPSYKTLVKIANIFNVTTDYLLGNTHENNDLSADLDPINKKIYRRSHLLINKHLRLFFSALIVKF